jgi:hypothetical protein
MSGLHALMATSREIRLTVMPRGHRFVNQTIQLVNRPSDLETGFGTQLVPRVRANPMKYLTDRRLTDTQLTRDVTLRPSLDGQLPRAGLSAANTRGGFGPSPPPARVHLPHDGHALEACRPVKRSQRSTATWM